MDLPRDQGEEPSIPTALKAYDDLNHFLTRGKTRFDLVTKAVITTLKSMVEHFSGFHDSLDDLDQVISILADNNPDVSFTEEKRKFKELLERHGQISSKLGEVLDEAYKGDLSVDFSALIEVFTFIRDLGTLWSTVEKNAKIFMNYVRQIRKPIGDLK